MIPIATESSSSLSDRASSRFDTSRPCLHRYGLSGSFMALVEHVVSDVCELCDGLVIFVSFLRLS